MTSSAPKTSGWAASELRTRFIPKSRIRTGLVSMSPWLDFVLILIFFLFAESRIVLQPGVVVELPTASFSEGVAPGMVATVVAARLERTLRRRARRAALAAVREKESPAQSLTHIASSNGATPRVVRPNEFSPERAN